MFELALWPVAGALPVLGMAAWYGYVTRDNVIGITAKLVGTLYVAAFIVFIAGLRQLIRQARPGCELVPSLVRGAGLTVASVTLAGDALAGGVAPETFSKPGLVVVRALSEASLVAFGAIAFLITALFLASASYAILATGVLRAWQAGPDGHWPPYLAAVPTICKGNGFLETVIAGGSTASGFCSYINSVAGLAYIAWLLAAGIAILRRRPARRG